MLDWLIIGGGVQGSYLSHVLTARLGTDPEGVRVLDPHPEPLARWQATTGNCGMRFLRSPAAHHIGLRTNDLLDYARARSRNWQQDFLEPYLRPSLELWDEHASHVMERAQLREMRIQGSAISIERQAQGWTTASTAGDIDSRRLVLCVGNSQPLNYPELTEDSVLAGERIRHVFDPRFRREEIAAGESVLIIGSGVTAAQLAIRLAGEADNKITILTDRLPEISWFDSDPGWNGPRLLGRLASIDNWDERLRLVSASRMRGTFPGDSAAQLLEQTLAGRLEMRVAVLQEVHMRNGRPVAICSEQELAADWVVYATGFSALPPALPLVQELQYAYELPVAEPGWPVVNHCSEWSAGLYVTGALAQLELGPVARNISGIRTFARRLVEELS